MNILPKPLKVTVKDGTVDFTGSLKICIDDKWASLKNRIEESLVFLSVQFVSSDANLTFTHTEGMSEEEYRLTIEDIIRIEATDIKGAFYGLMTLRQLFKTSQGTLQKCEIIDKPRFAYRGIMLDVARHFFGMEEVKELLDIMAQNKLNVFHFHLTEDQGWRIEIKKYPELAPKASIRKDDWKNSLGHMKGEEYGRGCYYTQEQIKELVSYAADRMISVVPEIDMPGHITSALSVFPELSCAGKPLEVSRKFGVKDTIGCVGNPDFMRFIKDVIDEVCELFPAPYFHIGGDEVPKTMWKTCPKCQALMKEKGIKTENNLQGYFTNEITEYLAQKGKKTIGWNEIMETNNLRKDAVVQWWMGKTAQNWAKQGGKMILSQCFVCYLDYPYIITNLEKIYKLGPEQSKMEESAKENVLGIEAPLWTEFVYDKKKYDFMLYPRVHAVAEAAWTQADQKDYNDFESRLQASLKELEERGVNYCPPSKYNPKGFRGLRQRFLVGRRYVRDPNCEVNL